MDNWDEHLPRIIHQINSAAHTVTKYSPYQIETGFSGTNPNDPYKNALTQVFCKNEEIKQRILEDHMKRRGKTEENREIHEFSIGDLVLAKTVETYKKDQKYEGPYEIVEIRNQGLSFLLRNLNTENLTTRHIKDLKKFRTRKSSVSPEEGKINEKNFEDKIKKRKKTNFIMLGKVGLKPDKILQMLREDRNSLAIP